MWGKKAKAADLIATALVIGEKSTFEVDVDF